MLCGMCGGFMKKHALLVAVAISMAATAHAQNWPKFRGAANGLAADDPSLPEKWSTTENVAWKTDIPGRGWGSPIVWGDHAFVVSAIDTATPADKVRPVREYIAGSLGGTMTGNDVNRDMTEHRWVLYDVDVQTGKIRWETLLRTAKPT